MSVPVFWPPLSCCCSALAVHCDLCHVRFVRYMADLVIAMLQNYAAATTLFPLSQADRDMAHQALPEPMLPGNWDGATGACVHDEPLHLAALQGSVMPCLGSPQAPCVEVHSKP